MNSVVIVGNLASDPEVRTTQSGTSNCTFRVAVQRSFANANGVREADFLSCVAWRQTADFVGKYLHKGSKVAVSGSIQTRNYEKDGRKVYVTEIIADRVESVGSRDSEHKSEIRTETFEPEINEDQLPF